MVPFYPHFILYLIVSIKIGLVKGQQSTVNSQISTLILKGHLVPAATTQFHLCSLKAATEDRYMVSGLCPVSPDVSKWWAALELRLWTPQLVSIQ